MGRRPQPLLVSRKEAARLLNLSVTTIDRLVKSGALRPNRVTRRVTFTMHELERFSYGLR